MNYSKMNLFRICIVFIVTFVIQMTSVKGQLEICNGRTFNETEGEITTPGYPYHVGFNETCVFHINVGSGGIELKMENVSLPDTSRIFIVHSSLFLVVGQHHVQLRYIYIDFHITTVFFGLPTNLTDTGSYGGVKLLYRRIVNDVCNYNKMANINERRIESPGYPGNYPVNSTCQYYIEALSKDHVVHIAFQDMSFGSSDVFTMYDAKDNSVILGPLIGPQEEIHTSPTNSSFVRIDIVSNNASSHSQRKYVIVYKELPRGSCQGDYFGNTAVARRVSSADKPCLYVLRAEPKAWVRAWFDYSPSGAFTVTVKSLSNSVIHKLESVSNRSGRVINFDGLDQGNSIEIMQNSTSFDLKFMAYTNYRCPFYEISEVDEKQLSTIGYPGNLPRNRSCEYYIRSHDETDVVYIRFSELFLSAGDDVTVYDAADSNVVARYNRTGSSFFSVTAKSSSVRVVLTTANTEPTVGRRFKLYHKVLSSVSCIVDYDGKSRNFSSLNRSCEYNIYLKSTPLLDLKFEHLYISKNNSIKIVQKRQFLQDLTLANLDSMDSGKTRYFRNKKLYNVVSIYADPNTLFTVSFKAFVSDLTINLHNPNGTLLSPYYPNSYLLHHFKFMTVVYHIQVPNDHVKLNFTVVQLAMKGSFYRDRIEVYDGNTTSAKRIGTLSGDERRKLPAAFLGSGKYLTVRFLSFTSVIVDQLFRFKAEYATETQVNYCKPIEWPHSYAERNLTLPGRATKYFCDEDYVRSTTFYKYVTRKCNFNGEWEAGETLKCSRICPRLDDKLRENSSLSWFYSSLYSQIHDGVYVRFSCSYYTEELHGPKTITCTSHGNYSALPPICKKRPKRDHDFGTSNNSWKYGVGFGSAAFIISIVIAVLRVFFGCFTCCTSSSSSNSMPMSNVQYSK